MNRQKHSFLCISMLVVLAFLSNAWAGQVVTDDAREWAKQAVNNEKTLGGVTSDNTVAVLYFHNKTAREELTPLQKGLTLLLITDLSIVKNLQVVERTRLQALTEEIGLGSSGLVEQGSAPRIGKLLGARHLVGGDILAAEQAKVRVQSSLVDVQTTSIIGQPLSEGALEELLRIEKDILFDLVKLLKIELTPEQEAKLRKPCSIKPDALLALFTGIDASDQKNYEKAAESYRKALKLDAHICVANDALGELQSLNLISGSKRSSELLRSLRNNTSLSNQLTPKDEIKHIPIQSNVSGATDTNINIKFPER